VPDADADGELPPLRVPDADADGELPPLRVPDDDADGEPSRSRSRVASKGA
jgi:hypothetical protein